MLTAIMWLFGIDLEQKVLQLKDHFHEAMEETSFGFRRELQRAGLFVIFVGLGTVALAVAMGIAAAWLFLWLEARYGSFIALAGVGGLCAVFAAVMFMFAIAAGRTRKSRKHPSEAPAGPRPSPSVPRRAQPEHTLPPLPENASLVDQLTHRFGQHALTASDEAVERAEKLIREASPGALLTTLALAAVVGVVIGRRGGLHQ
jgi:uncharacterized membrane protein YidH (DUF202 family)